jgi:hypothetical protein
MAPSCARLEDERMDDLLAVVLGVFMFAVLLGLIWGIDRI